MQPPRKKLGRWFSPLISTRFGSIKFHPRQSRPA
jgi:hypothetical protein